MRSSARSGIRPISAAVVLTGLAMAFACGSSDSDGPQASAGTSSGGGAGRGAGGAAGLSAGEAGSAGETSPADGSAGDVEGGAPGHAGEAGAPVNAGGQGGEGGKSDESGAGGVVNDDPSTLVLSGAITHVHDPDIIKEGDTFYLFSTGQGIQIRTSKDLKSWLGAGQVFATKPSWITTTDPSDPNNLWAPEVLYFGGSFHLYYAASKFGANQSCIGHATKDSLASSAAWVDLGAAYCSNTSGPAQDFNAIDPNPFQDEAGNLWLGFGSFWSGLKILRLGSDGNVDGPDLFSLATRPNTAVEAPHLQFHDGFYFLFESVDSCCQGAASTYKIMVGRSADVTGPYVDQDGALLSEGGGTLILQGGERWRGPGHNAILQDGARYWNVYHSYDADNGGVPTLRISELTWGEDNWPVSAGP
ncbi:MAG: arabinan endo-1,5-alpha-L-arabinosidase [Polyangiaceae bacterium]